MVGYDPLKKKLSTVEKTIVSGSTSILTRAIIHPFDVVKIRFQVQYEPISKKSEASKYRSIYQTVSTIVKEEGVLALWKGHLTGQILSMSFITAQFLWFEFFTKLYHDFGPRSARTDSAGKSVGHFLCGGLAACCTVAMNQPIDTVRTRLVSQGEPRVYTSITDACVKIATREGISGFYRGLLPSIMLYAPETAFRFGIYQALNSNWTIWASLWQRVASLTGLNSSAAVDTNNSGADPNKRSVSSLQATVNGSLSGVCAKTVVYPFDLAKKRLQVQGFEEARMKFGKVVKLNGVLDCFQVTLKTEGVLGLYKGYYPSMLKAALASGLVFFFYEEFTHIMGKLSD